jgi:hypothetical protein
MTGHERDAVAVDLSHPDRARRRAERGVDAQLLDVFEEFVEARAAEDTDHGAVSTAA